MRRATNQVTGMAVFYPDDPEHQHRRPDQQEPVSVHAAIERHRDALQARAGNAREDLADLPGLLDVTTDLYVTNPQVTIDVDREKAAVYGVTIDQVRQELFNAFGSRQVATIYTPSNDYQVILETKPRVPRRSVEPAEHLRENQQHRRRHARRCRHAADRARASPATACRPAPSIPLAAVTKPVETSARCWSTTRGSSRR